MQAQTVFCFKRIIGPDSFSRSFTAAAVRCRLVFGAAFTFCRLLGILIIFRPFRSVSSGFLRSGFLRHGLFRYGFFGYIFIRTPVRLIIGIGFVTAAVSGRYIFRIINLGLRRTAGSCQKPCLCTDGNLLHSGRNLKFCGRQIIVQSLHDLLPQGLVVSPHSSGWKDGIVIIA